MAENLGDEGDEANDSDCDELAVSGDVSAIGIVDGGRGKSERRRPKEDEDRMDAASSSHSEDGLSWSVDDSYRA